MVTFVAAVNVLLASVLVVPGAAREGKPVRIVAFGDSLTAGFGLAPADAFPAQLERALKAARQNVEVANGGVSGDTTGRALTRLDWAVPDGTDAVIVALGANDMLTGLPIERARANLEAIVTRLKARGIEVLIVGMRASRNLGDEYANAFDAIYPSLAEKHGLVLYPFFLAGVALDPKLNLADGIHPSGAGIAVIVERMLPTVGKLIERVEARRTASGRG
ncbi:MAG: arylesterase [Hyphomicrobiaceae bacterium]|nr:arylesterase [Hyphomicrobiaceae bacterium]